MLVTLLRSFIIGIGLAYLVILVVLIIDYIRIREAALEYVFGELIRWFIFSASLSLLPIVFNYIRCFNRKTEIEICGLA